MNDIVWGGVADNMMIRQKNLQNLPRSLSCERLTMLLRPRDYTLPPLEHRSLSFVAPERPEKVPRLPSLQLVVPVEDRQRPSSFLPHPEEALIEYRIPRGLPSSCLNRLPELAYQRYVPTPLEKGSGNTRPMSPLPRTSTAGHSDPLDDWNTFTMSELIYCLNEVSTSRPQYAADVRDDEPEKRMKKVPGPKIKSDHVVARTTEQKKEELKEKHAQSERDRRERHKRLVIEMYMRGCDYALEKAGWPRSSAKAPTKETVMEAMNIQMKMLGRLHVMMNHFYEEQLALKDRVIEELRRLLGNACKQDFCSLGAYQALEQSDTLFAPNHLPFRATDQGQHQGNLVQRWSSSTSSTTNKSLRSPSPNRSLSTPSRSFYSTDSGRMKRKRKRKREEDDDETTPPGLLRHGIARQSLDRSPRSTTFSHGSWCVI